MEEEEADYGDLFKSSAPPKNKHLDLPPSPQKFNSTSSLFIDSTISKPKNAELLHCAAVEVVKSVRPSIEATPKQLESFEIFNETKHPLISSTLKMEEMEIPTVETVERFIKAVYKIGQLAPESLVMAIAYMKRIMGADKLILYPFYWRRVLLSCLILASKVWEDQAVWNIDFIDLFPRTKSYDLGQLEKRLLALLNFDVSLKASEYAKIYFDIRANSAASFNSDQFAELKPLTRNDAEKLEVRSHDFTVKHTKTLHRSSGSVDDIGQALRSPRSVLN